MGKYMSIHTAECKCFSSPLPVQVLVHLSSTSPDHGCAELPMLLFFLLTPISSFLRLTSNSEVSLHVNSVTVGNYTGGLYNVQCT